MVVAADCGFLPIEGCLYPMGARMNDTGRMGYLIPLRWKAGHGAHLPRRHRSLDVAVLVSELDLVLDDRPMVQTPSSSTSSRIHTPQGCASQAGTSPHPCIDWLALLSQ